MKVRILGLALALAAVGAVSCGRDSVDAEPVEDDAAPFDAAADANLDQPDAEGPYDPASIYDLAHLRDVAGLNLTILGDVVHAQAGGRFVRELSIGYAGAGFPTAASGHDAGAHIFVETDAAGQALGNTDAVALNLLGYDLAGFTTECALRTGHPCAIALHNLLSPGRLFPDYPNPYRVPPGPILDSNELYVNLIEEMRTGVDATGTALTGPPARRTYEVQIATEGIRLLSMIGRAMVEQGISSAMPTRFLVAGHSKWGSAAAQMAAVDDRVVGALVAGFPMDFKHWVDLIEQYWIGELGIDPFEQLCGPATPCALDTTTKWSSFFATTIADPGDCGGSPCFGSGEEWIRQINLRNLRESSSLAGKKLGLIRNGGEAHHVFAEEASFEAGVKPDMFLFAPLSGHTFNTPQHSSVWRHFIRHVLDGVPPSDISPIEHSGELANVTLSATANGGTIVSAELYFRASANSTFGGLDHLVAYQDKCALTNNCTFYWSLASGRCGPIAITVQTASVGPCDLDPGVDQNIAMVFVIEVDDGSGDIVTLSSPVKVFWASP